jgi:hypothetical protein
LFRGRIPLPSSGKRDRSSQPLQAGATGPRETFGRPGCSRRPALAHVRGRRELMASFDHDVRRHARRRSGASERSGRGACRSCGGRGRAVGRSRGWRGLRPRGARSEVPAPSVGRGRRGRGAGSRATSSRVPATRAARCQTRRSGSASSVWASASCTRRRRSTSAPCRTAERISGCRKRTVRSSSSMIAASAAVWSALLPAAHPRPCVRPAAPRSGSRCR